jgi:hypothetical protein
MKLQSIDNLKPYPKNAKKQEFICKNCSNKWIDYRSNDKNKQYCSVKCKSEYSRIDRTCGQCALVFSINKSVLKTNATGKYCSRLCYWESMRTGVTKHKNGFRGIVRRNFPRPQTCARCAKTQNSTHIHHIIPFRYTQNNDLDNLIPLCSSCHKVVEIQTENIIAVDSDLERVFLMMSNMLRFRQSVTMSICK